MIRRMNLERSGFMVRGGMLGGILIALGVMLIILGCIGARGYSIYIRKDAPEEPPEPGELNRAIYGSREDE